MHITLNGEPYELANQQPTLVDLLQQLQLIDKRVAIEVNGQIVPRSEHASTTVQADDTIEIVQAIGGGQAQQPAS